MDTKENKYIPDGTDPQADLVNSALSSFGSILLAAAMRLSEEREKLLVEYDALELSKPETPLRTVAASIIVDVACGNAIDLLKKEALAFFTASSRAQTIVDDAVREKGEELESMKAKMAEDAAKKGTEKEEE